LRFFAFNQRRHYNNGQLDEMDADAKKGRLWGVATVLMERNQPDGMQCTTDNQENERRLGDKRQS